MAMDFVSARVKDPPAASRAYALVAVAAFDALVVARHWQGVYGDDGYPSEEAAVAGAASRVLAHLFPEQPSLRLDRQAEEAAGAGAAGLAGLGLGREVADRVNARADGDGSAQVWDGPRPADRPDRPGFWQPPPGLVSPPVQPLAGTWATWVLPPGDALRPPPPPAYGSPEYLAEAQEVVNIERALTDEQRRIARYWEGGQGTALPPGIWNRVVIDHLAARGATGPESVRTLALVNVALADAGVAAWAAKYRWWTPRPENAVRELVDPAWRPLLATPLFPAYVSGHSTYSAAVATVLGHLFPDDADRFRTMGEEAGMSRLYGGIHFRSDHVHGSAMGREIGDQVVARGLEDETPPPAR
jgi:PAP2 superfamily